MKPRMAEHIWRAVSVDPLDPGIVYVETQDRGESLAVASNFNAVNVYTRVQELMIETVDKFIECC